MSKKLQLLNIGASTAGNSIYMVDLEKEGSLVASLTGSSVNPIHMAYDINNDAAYAEVSTDTGFAICVVTGDKIHLYKQSKKGGATAPLVANDVLDVDFNDISRELVNAALIAGALGSLNDKINEQTKARIDQCGDGKSFLKKALRTICSNPSVMGITKGNELPSGCEEAAAFVNDLCILPETETVRRGIKNYGGADLTVDVEESAPVMISSLWKGFKEGAFDTLENPNCAVQVEEGAVATALDEDYNRPWFEEAGNESALMTESELAEAKRRYGHMAEHPSKVCESVLQSIHSISMVGQYVNIMLFGVAGCGKTTLAHIISLLTKTKCHVFQLEANTDTTSIWGSFQPRISGAGTDFVKEECPYSVTEAIKDPVAAWARLGKTGTVSKGEVLKETFDAANRWAFERGAQSKKDSGMDLVWVDSAVTKAFREGGILLLDEIDKPKNPEVLNVFNTVLATSGDTSYTLPNGEVIKRSKKLVVLLAGNYNRMVDTSLLSRAQEKFDLQTPDAKELARRALEENKTTDGQYLTSDRTGAEKMARVVAELANMARDEDIADGSTGERELIACVTKAAVLQCIQDRVKLGNTRAKISDENWVKAAVTTILNKSSQDPDSRNQLLSVMTNVYSESRVKKILSEMSDFVQR